MTMPAMDNKHYEQEKSKMKSNSGEFWNGRPVHEIVYSNEELLRSRDGTELVLRQEYHGDRDTWWVACLIDGIEIARSNVQYLQTIVWKETPKAVQHTSPATPER